MAHVNNAVYLDWAEEAIRAADPRPCRGARARAAALAARVPRGRRPRHQVRRPPGPTAAGWVCRIDDADDRPAVRRGAAATRPTGSAWVPGRGRADRHVRCVADAMPTAPPPTGPIRDRYEGPGPRRDVRPGTTPYRARYHRSAPTAGDHRAMAPRTARAATIAPSPNRSAPRAHGARPASCTLGSVGDQVTITHGDRALALAILAVALVGALVGTAGYAATIGRRQMRRIARAHRSPRHRDRPERRRSTPARSTTPGCAPGSADSPSGWARPGRWPRSTS